MQVSRRIAEEVARFDSEEVVLLRFFDIEKAYPIGFVGWLCGRFSVNGVVRRG